METPTVPGKQRLFPGGPIQIVPLSIVLGQFTCEGAATSAIRFPMTVVEKGVPADARGPVNFVPAKAGDVLHLGTITIRIIEDGSRTDMRIGVAEFTVPPRTSGPPPHWHEMHDEIFFTTKGTLRFHALDGQTVDSKLGDTMTVPTRSPHTFSNPFDEEAKFLNTFTPAHYINYFKLLATMAEEGKPMNPEANRKAMAYFATIGVSDDVMKMKKNP